jgi:hypothetical protein
MNDRITRVLEPSISANVDAKFAAQDRDGFWALYNGKPTYNSETGEWLATDWGSWGIHITTPPEDASKEIYQIERKITFKQLEEKEGV